MNTSLDNVNELLRLKCGDTYRLEHIKQTLENNTLLYISDKNYLQKLVEQHHDQIKKTKNVKFEFKQKTSIHDTNDSVTPTIPTDDSVTPTIPLNCISCGKQMETHTQFCLHCGKSQNPSIQTSVSSHYQYSQPNTSVNSMNDLPFAVRRKTLGYVIGVFVPFGSLFLFHGLKKIRKFLAISFCIFGLVMIPAILIFSLSLFLVDSAFMVGIGSVFSIIATIIQIFTFLYLYNKWVEEWKSKHHSNYLS